MEFDAKDARILDELQAEARLTMAELGRRVHLSQPAVTERVKRLEEAGVISGYRAIVNPLALGHGIRAVVRVGRCDYERMVKLIDATPEVTDAHNVTGDDSWILQLAVRDVQHLEAVISRFCTLTETATAVILRSIRERGPLRPAAQMAAEAGAPLIPAWPGGTAPELTAPARPAPARKPRRP